MRSRLIPQDIKRMAMYFPCGLNTQFSADTQAASAGLLSRIKDTSETEVRVRPENWRLA